MRGERRRGNGASPFPFCPKRKNVHGWLIDTAVKTSQTGYIQRRLIKGLEDLKVEIGDSPVSFAKAAAQYSACPSASRGGDLGEFGPGQMVKEFDTVVFNEPVGVVHGPIRTQFGYHLIYIRDRTE